VQVDSGVILAPGSDADAGDIVLSSGATLGVPADGNAGGVQVSNGATVAVIGLGFVTGDPVFAGAVATLFGGYAFSTSLDGGTESAFAGGVADYTTVDGREQIESSGGIALDTIVSYGSAVISSGGLEQAVSGSAASVTWLVGASETVLSRGIDSAATEWSGGMLSVSAGGTAPPLTRSSCPVARHSSRGAALRSIRQFRPAARRSVLPAVWSRCHRDTTPPTSSCSLEESRLSCPGPS